MLSPVQKTPNSVELAAAVPPREGLLPDSAAWELIAAAGGTAVIGFKNPSENRGVWRNRVLVTPEHAADLLRTVGTQHGISILASDTLLPVAKVRIPDLATFRKVKALPIVDYIEPVVAAGRSEKGITSDHTLAFSDDGSPSFTCDWGSLRTGGLVVLQGDRVSPVFARHQIPDAWRRSNGQGVVLGIVDTGVSPYQSELVGAFSSGLSNQTNRWIHLDYVYGGSWADQCGHGTRMAGVMAAPANGTNTAGVAWGSSLVIVRHADGVLEVNSWQAALGIRLAASQNLANFPRRVIAMPWESDNAFQFVSDEIGYWYYHDTAEVLFVAASGTSCCGLPAFGVIFPADRAEVIAVSLVDYVAGHEEPYHRADNIHYGPQVELAAICCSYATGFNSSDVVSLGGSSVASAVVAGIAALAWEQYPHFSNTQLRSHLRWAGHYYPNRNEKYGFGVLDALKAVGGMYAARIEIALIEDRGYIQDYRLTARPRGGNGPFSYTWSHGPTASVLNISKRWDETVDYTVTIRDSFDSVQQTTSVSIGPVGGGGGQCDPSQVIC